MTPLLGRLHLPFLLVTLVNTALITVVMTYLVMPRLARVMRPFLRGRRPPR